MRHTKSLSGPLLRLAAVTAGYLPGCPVLDQLNLEATQNGLTEVLGPNGVGKSTLVEVVAGYLPISSGLVEVSGHPAGSPQARTYRRVCRTKPALFPELAAGDHLAFGCRAAGVPLDDALARSDRYGLTPWLDTAGKALSSGNQRKLWLVLCTLGAAPLYLLDEPFQGLDAHGQEVLCAELREWAQHAAVLVITHDLPDELAVDERIILSGPTPSEEVAA